MHTQKAQVAVPNTSLAVASRLTNEYSSHEKMHLPLHCTYK